MSNQKRIKHVCVGHYKRKAKRINSFNASGPAKEDTKYVVSFELIDDKKGVKNE